MKILNDKYPKSLSYINMNNTSAQSSQNNCMHSRSLGEVASSTAHFSSWQREGEWQKGFFKPQEKLKILVADNLAVQQFDGCSDDTLSFCRDVEARLLNFPLEKFVQFSSQPLNKLYHTLRCREMKVAS